MRAYVVLAPVWLLAAARAVPMFLLWLLWNGLQDGRWVVAAVAAGAMWIFMACTAAAGVRKERARTRELLAQLSEPQRRDVALSAATGWLPSDWTLRPWAAALARDQLARRGSGPRLFTLVLTVTFAACTVAWVLTRAVYPAALGIFVLWVGGSTLAERAGMRRRAAVLNEAAGWTREEAAVTL